jgi:hypothetical protein
VDRDVGSSIRALRELQGLTELITGQFEAAAATLSDVRGRTITIEEARLEARAVDPRYTVGEREKAQTELDAYRLQKEKTSTDRI